MIWHDKQLVKKDTLHILSKLKLSFTKYTLLQFSGSTPLCQK